MKLNKTMKKLLAVVLSLALVITSITVNNTTSKAADVADIAVTAKLEDNSSTQIRADWTNPEGTVRLKYYVNEENEDNYAKAANGWVWSISSPTEIRTYLDTVSGTKGGIDFSNGGTFTIIVVAYGDEDCTEVIGRGVSNEVTIEQVVNKDLGLFVERYDEANMLAFLKWTKVSGAAKYIAYDADGNKAGESAGDWTQVTLPAKNTDCVYTVKAYDAEGIEIADITNNEVTARIDGEEETDPTELGYTLITNDGTEQAIAGNWSAIVADTNKVYYKTVDNGFSAFCASNANNWTQYAVKYVYKETGLKADTKYTFTADVEATSNDYTLSCDDVNWYNDAKDQTSVKISETVTTDAEGNATVTILAGIIGIKVELAYTNATFTEYIEEETTTEEVTDEEETTTEEVTDEEETTTEEITDEEETTTEEVTDEEETTTEEVTDEEETTTQAYDPGFDPSALEYTNLVCTGTEDLSIDYAIQNNTVVGLVPWYGDGGVTFMLQYSADAGIVSSVTVNGQEAGEDVVTASGAGFVKINPTNLADDAYTVIDVVTENGEIVVVIKKGTPAVVETTTEEITTEKNPGEETTTEEVTDEEPTWEDETPELMELTDCIKDNEWHENGGYSYYVGSTWGGSSAQMAVDPEDEDHVQIMQLTSDWSLAWTLQLKKVVTGLTPGETYTLWIDLYAAKADGTIRVSGDVDYTLEEGYQILEIQATANDAGTAEFVAGLGWVGLDNVLDFAYPEVYDADDNLVYPSDEEDPTTEAPTTEAPTTEAPTTEAPTTEAPTTEAPTTEAPTTEAPTTEAPTTVAPTTVAPTTKKVTVAKTKVKSATKKKSAKKAKISLKKIKGAKYQVQISKAKKFTKKNILVKKTVKKAKFTLTSKKIKNKKKLYVRARAIKVVDGKTYTGKWSKAKKIKIK